MDTARTDLVVRRQESGERQTERDSGIDTRSPDAGEAATDTLGHRHQSPGGSSEIVSHYVTPQQLLGARSSY